MPARKRKQPEKEMEASSPYPTPDPSSETVADKPSSPDGQRDSAPAAKKVSHYTPLQHVNHALTSPPTPQTRAVNNHASDIQTNLSNGKVDGFTLSPFLLKDLNQITSQYTAARLTMDSMYAANVTDPFEYHHSPARAYISYIDSHNSLTDRDYLERKYNQLRATKPEFCATFDRTWIDVHWEGIVADLWLLERAQMGIDGVSASEGEVEMARVRLRGARKKCQPEGKMYFDGRVAAHRAAVRQQLVAQMGGNAFGAGGPVMPFHHVPQGQSLMGMNGFAGQSTSFDLVPQGQGQMGMNAFGEPMMPFNHVPQGQGHIRSDLFGSPVAPEVSMPQAQAQAQAQDHMGLNGFGLPVFDGTSIPSPASTLGPIPAQEQDNVDWNGSGLPVFDTPSVAPPAPNLGPTPDPYATVAVSDGCIDPMLLRVDAARPIMESTSFTPQVGTKLANQQVAMNTTSPDISMSQANDSVNLDNFTQADLDKFFDARDRDEYQLSPNPWSIGQLVNCRPA